MANTARSALGWKSAVTDQASRRRIYHAKCLLEIIRQVPLRIRRIESSHVIVTTCDDDPKYRRRNEESTHRYSWSNAAFADELLIESELQLVLYSMVSRTSPSERCARTQNKVRQHTHTHTLTQTHSIDTPMHTSFRDEAAGRASDSFCRTGMRNALVLLVVVGRSVQRARLFPGSFHILEHVT